MTREKIAAVFLAAALLGGCAGRLEQVTVSETDAGAGSGSPAVAEVARGRYVESRWQLPPGGEGEYLARLRPAADGYDLATKGERLRRFHSADGESWQEVDDALLAQVEIPDHIMALLDWDGAGEYALLLVTYGDAGVTGIELRRGTADKGWETVPVDWTAQEAASGSRLERDLYPGQLTLGADRSFYITSGMNSLCRYSPEGELVNIYETRGPWALLPERLAVYEPRSAAIVYYDLQTEEEGSRVPVEAGMLAEGDYPTLFSQGETLYLISSRGLYRLAPGGTLFERMVDATSCSLGKPSLYIEAAAAGPGDTFLVKLTGDNLCRYAYDPDMPTRPDRALSVAALAEAPTVRQTAIEFQVAHPDVQVEVRALLDKDSAMTRADALRSLNTELLAGKGPDVLVLDDLPLASYVEKGVLADLSGPVGALTEEMLGNVALSLRKGDTLPAVPARFTAPLIAGEPERLQSVATLSALAAYVAAHPEEKVLYNLRPEALLARFYPVCAAGLVGEDGAPDADAVARFLADIGTLAAAGEDQAFAADIDGVFGGNVPAEVPEKAYDALSGLRFAYGKVSLYPFVLTCFDNDYREPYWALMMRTKDILTPGNVADYFIPLPGTGERAFTPVCILGVNAASAQRELGEQFVLTALSPAVQGADLHDGLPVLRGAYETFIDTDQNSVSGVHNMDGDELMMECTPAGMQTPLLALLQTLDTPYVPDGDLYGMLTEAAARFFGGEVTAEQAAGSFASRAKAYLAQ